MKHYLTILRLACLTAIVALAASCGEKKQTPYVTPYTADGYACPEGVGKFEEYEYDKKGNLIILREYGFNKDGLLTSLTVSDKDSVTYQQKLTYAGKRLLKIEDKNSKYELHYNSLNQLDTVKVSNWENGELIPAYDEVYTYTPEGKVKEQEVRYYESEIVTIEYFYHSNGKLASTVEHDMMEAYETAYDSISGRVTAERRYEGDPLKLQDTYTYTYTDDDDGRWVKAEVKNKRGRMEKRLERTYSEGFDSSDEADEEEVVASSIERPELTGSSISDYFADVKYRLSVHNAINNTPSGVLFVVLFLLTVAAAVAYFMLVSKNFNLFENFFGQTTDNGMKRLWMFNKEPYVKVATSLLILLAAFVTAIFVLLIVGGVTYAVLYIVKWILIIIVWVGYILLILGVLALLGKSGYGCLPVIIGGIIVGYKSSIHAFGESLVEWGFDFMNDLNIFAWGLGLFTEFWDVILITFLTPLVLFSGFAALIIILVLLLMGIELGVMRIYSIKRPCPSCGSTATPEYWVDNRHRHPVSLHPGVYGVFTHKHPETGDSVPTMIFNGKGKLLRKCSKCGKFMKADAEKTFGTEKHIGIVGHRSSGKSYLLYTALNELLTYFGDRASQMDADYDTNIASNVKRIAAGGNIQTDLKDSYRAVQLIVKRKMNPVPYHLFFYDVAGEKFNQASTASKTAMEFYRNVQTIMFVVDPAMIDYSFSPASDKMEKWLSSHSSPEHFSADGTFSTLKSILEAVGRKTRDIDFVFVLVKADMGYLEACGYPVTGQDVGAERFMCAELGLGNLVNAAKGAFRSVKFDIASVKPSFRSRLTTLFADTLKHLGVS